MLTTREKVKAYLKAYLKINDTSDDLFIDDMIQDSQGIIEGYCKRHFDIATYTNEQHNIMHKIFTREYPIKSVISIKRSGTEITNYRVFPAYVELLDYKSVTMSNKLRYVDNEETYAEITYQAGYETIPFDLQKAATELAALFYLESRENRLGIDAESEGAVSYTYTKKNSELPLNISCILDRYKKVGI